MYRDEYFVYMFSIINNDLTYLPLLYEASYVLLSKSTPSAPDARTMRIVFVSPRHDHGRHQRRSQTRSFGSDPRSGPVGSGGRGRGGGILTL